MGKEKTGERGLLSTDDTDGHEWGKEKTGKRDCYPRMTRMATNGEREKWRKGVWSTDDTDVHEWGKEKTLISANFLTMSHDVECNSWIKNSLFPLCVLCAFLVDFVVDPFSHKQKIRRAFSGLTDWVKRYLLDLRLGYASFLHAHGSESSAAQEQGSQYSRERFTTCAITNTEVNGTTIKTKFKEVIA